MGKVGQFCLFGIQCLTVTAVLVFSVIILANLGYDEIYVGDSHNVEEIPSDWSVKPFVEMVSVTNSEGAHITCPSSFEPVFTKRWGGITQGFDIKHRWQKDSLLSFKDLETKLNFRGVPGMYEHPLVLPVAQTDFGGKILCGKRGGDSFVDVKRPVQGDIEGADYTCPEGTAPCNASFSAQNQVCYPEADHSSSCPITEMKFMPRSEAQSMANDPNFKILEWDSEDDLVVVFTKTADSLPITGFKVEDKPCMDPTRLSYSEAQVFYPLEDDATRSVCNLEDNTSLVHDPRYTKSGFSVDEFTVQERSGVFQTLKSQFLFDRYTPRSIFSKKLTSYDFWTRPTISWDISCSANVADKDVSRRNAYDKILQYRDYDTRSRRDELYATSHMMFIFAIIALVLVLPSAFIEDKTTMLGYQLGLLFYNIVIFGIFALVLMSRVSKEMKRIERRQQAVENMDIVNGCVDEFARQDTPTIANQLQQQQDIVTGTIYFSAQIVTGITLFWCVLLLLVIYQQMKAMKAAEAARPKPENKQPLLDLEKADLEKAIKEELAAAARQEEEAVAAQAKTPKPEPVAETPWSGHYFTDPETRFEMTVPNLVISESGEISGNGEDEVGKFNFKGQVQIEGEFTFELVKDYEAFPSPVYYFGNCNEELTELNGSWGYASGEAQGDFKLAKN